MSVRVLSHELTSGHGIPAIKGRTSKIIGAVRPKRLDTSCHHARSHFRNSVLNFLHSALPGARWKSEWARLKKRTLKALASPRKEKLFLPSRSGGARPTSQKQAVSSPSCSISVKASPCGTIPGSRLLYRRQHHYTIMSSGKVARDSDGEPIKEHLNGFSQVWAS